MNLLLQLIALHFLCDFPLQGDFLARGKNHRAPLPGVPWQICLLAHSFIHAGAYSLVVCWQAAGVLGLAHMAIDWAKSDGAFLQGEDAFWRDQVFHVISLVACAAWMATP